MRTFAHLHLPRLQAHLRDEGSSDVISVKTGREPIRYVSQLALVNCEFKVSQTGRRRCIIENVRNVHAWVVGDWCELTEEDIETPMYQAVYNPWKGTSFVDIDTLMPVHAAQKVIMLGKDVYYI